VLRIDPNWDLWQNYSSFGCLFESMSFWSFFPPPNTRLIDDGSDYRFSYLLQFNLIFSLNKNVDNVDDKNGT